uniref:Putative secreted protein n=1 Tax=Anopheles darlingi TaxID=43151 RepID=A0A2M4DB89_ANODA
METFGAAVAVAAATLLVTPCRSDSRNGTASFAKDLAQDIRELVFKNVCKRLTHRPDSQPVQTGTAG